MKDYHKLNYKINNILCFFYNKHYFFLLDNIDTDGYISIFNEKKDYEMNIIINTVDNNISNVSNITINYEKPIKIIIPKNSINFKLIINCITYNLNNNDCNNNIITYKQLFLSKHSLIKYNELFNPNRDNMYIEKDIIDIYYNQIGKINTNNDYLNIVNTKIIDGVIINRKQIDKLNKINTGCAINKDNSNYKGLKIIVENITKQEFILIIIIHIGSIELGIEIINKFIKTKNNKENYLFCFNINEDICKNELIKSLISKFCNFIITSTINYGNDIVPSILAYNYINSKYKFEYVLKIQTKNKKSWFDGNINILIINSIDLILELLTNDNIDSIGSEKFLTKMDDYNTDIIYKYLQYDNLNIISIISKLSNKEFIKIINKIILYLPKDFICNNYKKNNYHIFKDKDISNYKLIKHYLNEGYNKNYSYKNKSSNITFFAGTMFLCKKKIFDNMNTLYHKIINASIINNFYYDNIIFKKMSPVHTLERLFGYTYNNLGITNYKKPIIYASYLHDTNIDSNRLKETLDKICYKLFITDIQDTENMIYHHFVNIIKMYKNIKDNDDNKYILLLTDITDITDKLEKYIYNFLHFNTYTLISYGESYNPYYHFPISNMWIIKYSLINEFIETYKKDDKLFLLNFSNIIINKYNYYCL